MRPRATRPALATLLALLPGPASAHGYVASPQPRLAGPASLAACGSAVTEDIRRDNTSHIEGLPDLAAGDVNYGGDALCNLWLCRGLQYEDNMDNVQIFAPGEEVNVRVRLTIPHDGWANVSVVETETNTVLGEPLVAWPDGYANETLYYARELPLNNTNFNITMPDVSAECNIPGACVLQWWWYAKTARQTYESCIDFTMGGATE